LTRLSAAVAGVIDAKHKIEEANFFTKGTYVFHEILLNIIQCS